MSKYMHEYNKGKCRSCSQIAFFEFDERTGNPIKKSELMVCTGCKSVEYCCKEHQVEDWANHKKFCKRFRKLIAEYECALESRPPGSAKPAKPSPYPLHDFVEKADWHGLLQYLTEHPSYDVDEIKQHSPEYMSPLILACGLGQIECVRILIDRGANYTDECNSINLTPLQYSSWWGHDDIVQLLIDRGADVNQTNTHGTFALGYATMHLQPEVVDLLICNGANVDQRNIMGWTPLMQMVCMGASIQEDSNDDKRSDLQKKLEDNPKIISIIKMLLGAGADINAQGHSSWGVQDFKGDTALNLTDGANKIDIIECLISRGALLDVQRESDGRNALLAAAEHNENEVVDLLIRSGADVTVRDNNGRDYWDLLELPWPRDEDDE